jgi:hypothetical protein
MTDKKTVPIKKKKSSKKDSASSQVGIGDLNNQLAQMIKPSPCTHSRSHRGIFHPDYSS